MTIFITLFLIVLFLGMPIAFAMGVPSLAYIFASGNSTIMAIIPQKIFGGLNSFTLLAVPFFLFAAVLTQRHRGASIALAAGGAVLFAFTLLGYLAGGQIM